MRVSILGVVLSVAAAVAAAQPALRAAPDPANFGTVTGHVMLPESNLPARFAGVALQPVDMKPRTGTGADPDAKMPVTVYQTGLDGSYRMDRVAPGTYYVVVTLPGYLSPIAQFTEAQLTHPTVDMQQQIAATVPTVTVLPNNAATADVHLTRGASISGAVRFDDGSPYASAALTLLKRDAAGRFQATQAWRGLKTDEDGRFHFYGLDAGDYTIRVALEVKEQKQSAALGWVTNSTSSTKFSMQMYSGDALTEKRAKVLTLSVHQALNGEDITIPVSKLHALSGAVIDARSGQPLNAGRVTLIDTDGAGVASALVDPETRTFSFTFAPEGEYTLKVTDAAEVEPAQPEPAAHDQRPRQRTLRAYEPAGTPLLLHGDVTGVTIPVTEKPAKTQ